MMNSGRGVLILYSMWTGKASPMRKHLNRNLKEAREWGVLQSGGRAWKVEGKANARTLRQECARCVRTKQEAKAFKTECMRKSENVLFKTPYLKTCNYLLVSLWNERINPKDKDISDLCSYQPCLHHCWDMKTSGAVRKDCPATVLIWH